MKSTNVIDQKEIAIIKSKIIDLKNKGGLIHVSVKPGKKRYVNATSYITEIYDRFFYVSSKVGYYEESFLISYISLLTKEVIIDELYI